MAFFADLTPYTYWDASPQDPSFRDEPWPDLPLVNVGWLDADHPFPTGQTPDELLARLEELARVRVRQTRGYHYCQLCWHSLRNATVEPVHRDLLPHESAEFRVKGSGVVYALPQLALHYISAHNYLPPAEFCKAAMTPADPPT